MKMYKSSAYKRQLTLFYYQVPPGCKKLHHEVELGVVIGKTATSVSESNAMDHVGGYALALDMTARDIQDAAKKLGWP